MRTQVQQNPCDLLKGHIFWVNQIFIKVASKLGIWHCVWEEEFWSEDDEKMKEANLVCEVVLDINLG